MIIKEYIKRFEKMGFGMFVHFGSYSVYGKGEWSLNNCGISHEDYEKLADEFNPKPGWAEELAAAAKMTGCKYITLTTRHHDGFSLFDTCGLNDYDTVHRGAKRDLVREFVDACNKEGLVPFFYHTLLDWREKSFNENFPEYLKYLRRSVELLCTNYGKIGGIWFDGMWAKPEENWEEDALYGMIRSYQPEAMIINNTGFVAPGALGHIELDSVTFERGRPEPINLETSPKYVASEMCQVFGSHWGYTKNDFKYKSLIEIIEDYCVCRRHGANYLLNIGPKGDGSIRPLDYGMLSGLGEWVDIHKEALYLPRPTDIEIEGKEKDFILKNDNTYYLFVHGIPMGGSINVVQRMEMDDYTDRFTFDKKIKAIKWLDNEENVDFTQDGDKVTVCFDKQRYGNNIVVKVARIEVE